MGSFWLLQKLGPAWWWSTVMRRPGAGLVCSQDRPRTWELSDPTVRHGWSIRCGSALNFRACWQLPAAFLINELLVSLRIFKGRCPEAGPHGVSSGCRRCARTGRLWRNHEWFRPWRIKPDLVLQRLQGQCWASEEAGTRPKASALKVNGQTNYRGGKETDKDKCGR